MNTSIHELRWTFDLVGFVGNQIDEEKKKTRAFIGRETTKKTETESETESERLKVTEYDFTSTDPRK